MDSPNPQQRLQQFQGHGLTQHSNHNAPAHSLLALLASEENKIAQRKTSIQRYGATWIRPPGIAKTYQTMMDEEHEREEQDILARREQGIMDMAAAQQDAANAEERADNGDEMEDVEGERDLDDEVPEAEEEESDVSADEVESDGSDTEGLTPADVTFNEDSFIEGSMLEGQVTQMLAMEEASMAGTLQEARDLDEDIPEAGEYEHTDSSLIDTSEDEPSQLSMIQPSATRPARLSDAMRVIRQDMARTNRRSLNDEGSSSVLDGSSFLRSSPAATRASLRSRFMGARGGRAC